MADMQKDRSTSPMVCISLKEGPANWRAFRSLCVIAGLTYCAIGALFFLDRVPANPLKQDLSTPHWNISFKDSIRWLALRQTTDIFEDEESDGVSTPEETKPVTYPVLPPLQGMEPVQSNVSRTPQPKHALDVRPEDIQYAGFNGRVNKIADTCYCFFVEGSLAVSKLSNCRVLERTDDPLDVGMC